MPLDGVAPEPHDVHWFAAPPVHVTHDEWHDRHCPADKYLPLGHVRHALGPASEHVTQDASHGEHAVRAVFT